MVKILLHGIKVVIDSFKVAVPNVKKTVGKGLEIVEERLLQTVSGHGELIDPVLGHLAKAGGKRVRPLLTLLCSQLNDPKQPVTKQAIDSAVAVEIIHIATLYHDDVMDSAPMRRGALSAQQEWSNSLAILAGDVLFAKASQIIATMPKDMIMRHAQTCERLCAGQMRETFGAKQGENKVEHYLQVLADKTGSLVSTSVYFGGKCANADEQILKALDEYGEKIGVAFQLVDDVIDLRSDSKTSGKTPGTDLLEGVDTMPILLLREKNEKNQLNIAEKELLKDIDSDLNDPEKLQSVLERLRENIVLEETMQMAMQERDKAVEAIEILPNSEVKRALIAFADVVVNRKK